ncbi:hypothetical protein VTJ04DRAFT_10803 [Mycothermus thermophilus]|uniref:uncharacterized protein n=1 Tax=Humicola insolens TaxID=85995 RepID=UPI003742EFB9
MCRTPARASPCWSDLDLVTHRRRFASATGPAQLPCIIHLDTLCPQKGLPLDVIALFESSVPLPLFLHHGYHIGLRPTGDTSDAPNHSPGSGFKQATTDRRDPGPKTPVRSHTILTADLHISHKPRN